MSIFESAAKKVMALLNRDLGQTRKEHLLELIADAKKWQPSPDNTDYSFYEEMDTRIKYYHGAMQADTEYQLKRQFPQTWQDMRREQINVPLVKSEINNLARVFVDGGEIYLADNNGKRVDSDAFDEMIEQAQVWGCLKQVDAYTQLCQRAMFKPWFDDRAGHMRISVWPQHQTFIVPNAMRWWDVDSAYAVLFEMPGADGISSTSSRYEVWGYRDPSVSATTGGSPTLHFITDTEGNDTQVNEGDENPIRDENGNHIYPFVWWRADNTTDLYALGDEDKLTINRMVNLSLTNMKRAEKFQAYGIWVHTMAENGSELGVKTVSPSTVVDLVPNATLQNVAPNLPLREVWDVNKDIISTAALLKGLPSYAVRADSGPPESGYSLKVRSRPLTEHRADMVEIYKPQLVDSIRRLILMHNAYRPDATIDANLNVVWVPGEIDVPEDPEQLGRVYAAEIQSNVSTSADWRMARYDEDKETAQKSVQENAEFNKGNTKAGSLFDDANNFQQASMAEQLAVQLEQPQENDEDNNE